MFGSQVLEVVIGLVLMYLLLSLICSSIREGIEAVWKARAGDLQHGIRELFQDRDGVGLTKALYEHPLVYGLFKGAYTPGKTGNLPSYIPSKNFAVALMDIVARGPSTPTGATPVVGAGAPAGAAVGTSPAMPVGSTALSVDSLRVAVGRLQNVPVQRALMTAIDTAQGDIGRAQANVEAWFDSSMERVSGWYKRRTQTIIFVVGLVLTLVVNADTLTLIESLVQDDAIRKAVIAEAGAIPRDREMKATDAKTRYEELKGLGFPVGWKLPNPCDLRCIATRVTDDARTHIPGWLITAFAISLGAPFWFDTLKRVMEVRSTMKPKPKQQSPEEDSRDRQARPAVPSPVLPATPTHAHEWARGNPQEGVI
jgi:hypothetical protein